MHPRRSRQHFGLGEGIVGRLSYCHDSVSVGPDAEKLATG